MGRPNTPKNRLELLTLLASQDIPIGCIKSGEYLSVEEFKKKGCYQGKNNCEHLLLYRLLEKDRNYRKV